MDLLIENDKTAAPFLLASSFNNLIHFEGSHITDGILYWKFSPKSKAQILLQQFDTKTEPKIPSKDLFEAIEAFWRQISEMKNSGGKK